MVGRERREITADTNLLVRAVVRDDVDQAKAAENVLKHASVIAVPLPCLCEFVWVLRRAYGLPTTAIAAAIRALLNAENVIANRPAVEAGLALLDTGGDFADSVIAFEGTWLGGETFVSFDKIAVARLAAIGVAARLLG